MTLRLLHLSGLLLVGLTALTAIPASASGISYGSGIAVDGDLGDWDQVGDFFAPMTTGGDPAGDAIASLFLRYDCSEHVLYALALDGAGDGFVPVQTAADAWLRLYGEGLADDLLIDGDGDGDVSPRSFQWVLDGFGEVVGFEASAALTEGPHAAFEARLPYGAGFASSGAHAYFDVNDFNDQVDALDQPETRIRVQYPFDGGPAYFPTTDIDLDGDGNSDIVTTSWCIDTDHTINNNTWYCAEILSSYNYPDGFDDTRWENLDAVNWILNQGFVGQPADPFGAYTYGDVQMAIWSLIEDASTPSHMGPTSPDRIMMILDAADAAVGLEDPAVTYEPPCDGVVGVILVPTNCDNGNYAQFLVAQMLVSEFPAACSSNDTAIDVLCEGGVVDAADGPAGFALSPAHPNPFNPATVLTVTLAETGPASLKVYDLAGRLVDTLFDGLTAAGSHDVHFVAGELPSGVYFAVLQSETATISQKLLLVK